MAHTSLYGMYQYLPVPVPCKTPGKLFPDSGILLLIYYTGTILYDKYLYPAILQGSYVRIPALRYIIDLLYRYGTGTILYLPVGA